MKYNRIAIATGLGILVLSGFAGNANAGPLRAGVASVDVSPIKFPVIVNGGFLADKADKVLDRLYARTVVLDDGSQPIAITVVDSCMMPRDMLDKAKADAARSTGIPVERMLISATHTHTAPSTMGTLGTPPDPDYVAMLPGLITESIVKAFRNLQPAKIGWTVVEDFDHTHTRRWIRRPDKMIKDPFGVVNVRANMHPGYLNPDVIGPSGPVDPALSLISIQSDSGKPLAVFANYSMHYFGTRPVSADYFGMFSAKIAQKLGVKDGDGFVGIMSQGTSGDQHWMDYGKAKTDITIQAYADQLAKSAFKALGQVKYQNEVPIAMAQATLKLTRRLPDAKRLEWAHDIKSRMTKPVPKDVGEVYACEAIELDANPNRELILQAVRIGELGLTAIPNEVYAITGLKLKTMSPFKTTVNIELANGAEGYIPPPEQHKLGGYTTWPARTAALEVMAEPKIVETLLTLLEKVSGKPRQPMPRGQGEYARSVLEMKPLAYWNMSEIAGEKVNDASGHDHQGQFEAGVALYLNGPNSKELADSGHVNRSAHFAGGRMTANVALSGSDQTVSLWFWNGMPTDARPVTGHLFETLTGDTIAIGGAGNSPGRLIVGHGDATNLVGRSQIANRSWNHLAFVRQGGKVMVYLNGQLEVEGELNANLAKPSANGFYLGGRANGQTSFEGKLDEVAIFDRALTDQEITQQFQKAGQVGKE